MFFKILILNLCLLVFAAGKGRVPRVSDEYRRIHTLRNSLEDDKIVGGQEVEPHSIPYQISFQSVYGFHFCGAAIYNNNTVITAAHCCDGQNPSSLMLLAGAHNLARFSGTEQKIRVSRIIIHPHYKKPSNDICLLKIKEPFMFNEYISGVPMPKQDQEFEGEAVVSGWGRLVLGGSSPNSLMAVSVPLVSYEKCQKAYDPTIYDVDKTMICAGKEGKDSCHGDSGGPLTCGGIHCGIVSWGIGCGNAKYPGVYAKTSKYVDWIQENAD